MPVFAEADPADQEVFRAQLSQILNEHRDEIELFGDDLEDLIHEVVVFAAVAAFSGRPEVTSGFVRAVCISDATLLQAVRDACAQGPFFRGGQAHGALRKARRLCVTCTVGKPQPLHLMLRGQHERFC